MSTQLDMFVAPPPTRADFEDQQRKSWKVCWDWDGPTVGGFCTIDTIGTRVEGGGNIYAYTELARLLEERPDGTWLAVIEMGERDWYGTGVHRWDKDGTRVILEICDIWPPVPLLQKQRAEEEKNPA